MGVSGKCWRDDEERFDVISSRVLRFRGPGVVRVRVESRERAESLVGGAGVHWNWRMEGGIWDNFGGILCCFAFAVDFVPTTGVVISRMIQ